MSYEEEEARLPRLWNELLSDESDFSPDVSEYELSSEGHDSSDDDIQTKERVRRNPEQFTASSIDVVPVLAKECSDSAGSVQNNVTDTSATVSVDYDSIIDAVIAQNSYESKNDDVEAINDTSPDISCGPVTGNFISSFTFDTLHMNFTIRLLLTE